MTDSNKLGPPPVEPMPDVAWSRIERGLWARLDGGQPTSEHRTRRWIWLAVPIAAVAAAIIALSMRSGDQVGPRPPVDALSRVVTGAAPSSISFGDSHVQLEANSAIVMNREGPTVILEQGAAWFTVAPRQGRSPFVVVAGDATVQVVGTRFRVSRDGERANVRVEHGLVQARFRGIEVNIGASQEWSSDHPSEVVTITTELGTGDAKEPLDRSGSGSGSGSGAAATAGSLVTAQPREPSASALDRDREEFERLTALEARDPKPALAGYLRLGRGNTPWSPLALYAAGRLAADLRDPRAVELLTTYLRRFPKGTNAADARQVLVRFKGETP
ncbi:MAG: hypothetical protein JWO36_2509 [Myxococcales bacterium]|nr:hypothetical protein [Myxococcales bacterium]